MTAASAVMVVIMVVMVVTVCLRGSLERTAQERCNRIISTAGDARIELDVGFIKCELSAYTDTTADEGINAC